MFIAEFGDPRLPDRFWDKVVVVADASTYPGPCWIWTRGTDKDGYGIFTWNGSPRRAHRVAYSVLIDEIPQGLVSDHLCRVHGCVNPAHIEPVTDLVNLMRGDTPAARNAAKTHCYKGHPLDRARKNGERYCGTCHNASQNAWRQANIEKARKIGREGMRRHREKARTS